MPAQSPSAQSPSAQSPSAQSPSARSRSRVTRTVLTIAATAVVVLVPTACDYASAAPVEPGGSEHTGHVGAASDGQTVPAGAVSPLPDEPTEPSEEPTEPVEEAPVDDAEPEADPEREAADDPAPAPPAASALQTLGDDCSGSDLESHDGFQDAPRCVAIAFGEVAAADRSPSLLITDAPTEVGSDEAFTLTVSTRNLVRDRFLGAAAGGYYRESSFLNAEGIQRGHFHTACRMLPSLDEAPDSAPAPEFFVATQDNGGGSRPDSVAVPVPGLAGPGVAQCAVWAGDGSHRVPMMERANQTPAFDMVRITVG